MIPRFAFGCVADDKPSKEDTTSPRKKDIDTNKEGAYVRINVSCENRRAYI